MNIAQKFLMGLLLSTLSAHSYTQKTNTYDFDCPEKKIVVIIPSYNNEKWVEKNLDSVRTQNYGNYIVIYLNDCSKDKTGTFVKDYITKHQLKNQFLLVNNKKRVGALENLYKAIHTCKNTDIIVTLDGDDWLAHKNVLKIINSIYQDPNVWLTYGQYKAVKGKFWWCTDFSQPTIHNNTFRTPTAFISHLRTFYAGLFKLINTRDLMYHGEFYQMTWDKAMMFPMIEMTDGKFKRIKDVLYIYNDTNPINDHKVNKTLQRALSDIIIAKEPYQPITWDKIIHAQSKV